MRKTHVIRFASAGVLAMLTFGALPGCGQAAATGAAALPDVVRNTPEETARCLLAHFQAEQDALGSRNRAAAEAVARQSRRLLAEAELQKRGATAVAANSMYKAMLGTDYPEAYRRNWRAIVGYYLPALSKATPGRLTAGDGESRATLKFNAVIGDDAADFVIDCVRGDDRFWAVSDIRLDRPKKGLPAPIRAASTTASQPASQP